MQTRVLFAMKN